MNTVLVRALRAGAAAALLALAWSGASQASVVANQGFDVSYTMDYAGDPATTPPLTDVLWYARYPDRNLFTWDTPGLTITAGTEDTETFPPPVGELNAAVAGALLGVAIDAGNTAHVVVGMDSTVASDVTGHDWSEIFPNADEAVLAASLEHLGDPNLCENLLDCLPEFGHVQSFILGDLTQIPDPANTGQTLNGYFAIPGDFTFVSFSGATVVGGGSASNIPLGGGTTVPEPAAWALMIIGLGALGWAARRRRDALTAL
jgi:hypothetical protein